MLSINKYNLNMYRKEMEGVLYKTCMKTNKYRRRPFFIYLINYKMLVFLIYWKIIVFKSFDITVI